MFQLVLIVQHFRASWLYPSIQEFQKSCFFVVVFFFVGGGGGDAGNM